MMRREKLYRSALWVDVLLVLVVLVVIFPLIWILLTSLKGRFEIAAIPPRIFFKPTFENYDVVFVRDAFHRYFKDSIIIAVGSTALALFLGTMSAYSMTRYRVGGDFLPFWVISIRMFPPIAIILPVYILMRNLGLLDTFYAVVIMHTLLNLPFVVWLMSGFFREVPNEIDEAAMIDGCSIFSSFFRVVLPVVLPGILATAVFCLITSWNEFLFSLVLSGRNVKTLPVAAAFYVTDRDILWGPMAAVGVTASIPIIIFTMLIQKHLVRGLTYGAVK
jgi:multiple sugar transport system permease protein